MKLTTITILLFLSQMAYAQNGAQIIRDANGKVVTVNSKASAQGTAQSSANSQSTTSPAAQLSEVEIAIGIDCFDFEAGTIATTGTQVCTSPYDMRVFDSLYRAFDLSKDGAVFLEGTGGIWEELIDGSQYRSLREARWVIQNNLDYVYVIRTSNGNAYKFKRTTDAYQCNAGLCLKIKLQQI